MTPDFQSGDAGFESRTGDCTRSLIGKVLECDSRGCGFKSHRAPVQFNIKGDSDMQYVLYFALVFIGFIGGLTTYPFLNELRDEFDDYD